MRVSDADDRDAALRFGSTGPHLGGSDLPKCDGGSPAVARALRRHGVPEQGGSRRASGRVGQGGPYLSGAMVL